MLVELARHSDGIGLDEIAKAVHGAKPTVHRALASLIKAGLAEKDGRGRYVLGDEFLRMAFAHHEARPDHVRVQPVLERLCERYGETTHYAVLDGRTVVYRSKVDPVDGAVRLTSTVGGRNPAHCTAVGKLLLSFLLVDESAVADWIGDRPLEKVTDRTLTTARELHIEFEKIRDRGYSVDDRENEAGINCFAVPAFLTWPSRPSGAISISALAYRTPLKELVDDFAAIRTIVGSSW
ncbi:IclR family transcriptional regulator [Mycobacterium sp. DSM 3803]|nr:IclR family transcriptional regulator [Mycobacterium sp. DSM 3803]